MTRMAASCRTPCDSPMGSTRFVRRFVAAAPLCAPDMFEPTVPVIGVASVPRCGIPSNYRKLLEMLFELTQMCNIIIIIMGSRQPNIKLLEMLFKLRNFETDTNNNIIKIMGSRQPHPRGVRCPLRGASDRRVCNQSGTGTVPHPWHEQPHRGGHRGHILAQWGPFLDVQPQAHPVRSTGPGGARVIIIIITANHRL